MNIWTALAWLGFGTGIIVLVRSLQDAALTAAGF